MTTPPTGAPAPGQQPYGQQQPYPPQGYQQPGPYGQQGYQQPYPPQAGYAAPGGYGGVQAPQIPTPTGLGFMGAVKHVFKNYANFNGRAMRHEFWFYALFCIIINVALYVLMGIGAGAESGGLIIFAWILLVIFGLATIIPSIAVGCRRLHDQGRSGLFLLVSFIPFVGGIILLVLLAQATQPADNQYGLAPRE